MLTVGIVSLLVLVCFGGVLFDSSSGIQVDEDSVEDDVCEIKDSMENSDDESLFVTGEMMEETMGGIMDSDSVPDGLSNTEWSGILSQIRNYDYQISYDSDLDCYTAENNIFKLRMEECA